VVLNVDCCDVAAMISDNTPTNGGGDNVGLSARFVTPWSWGGVTAE